MTIKYLNKLEVNKTINRRKIRGVRESEILKVEKRLKIKFPLPTQLRKVFLKNISQISPDFAECFYKIVF